jgi:hypothetical protein
MCLTKAIKLENSRLVTASMASSVPTLSLYQAKPVRRPNTVKVSCLHTPTTQQMAFRHSTFLVI